MNHVAEDRPAAGASLYEAVAMLERHFGGAFVHAPARWGTADGVISYRAVYPYTALVRRQLASERLHLARAAAIGQGGDHALRLAREDEGVAHGAA